MRPLLALLLALLSFSVARIDYPFVFRDVGESAGLFPALAGSRGHAAAWGDLDGDGWPDLFVGTFHMAQRGVKANRRLTLKAAE